MSASQLFYNRISRRLRPTLGHISLSDDTQFYILHVHSQDLVWMHVSAATQLCRLKQAASLYNKVSGSSFVMHGICMQRTLSE